jgi:hypothetical protein
MQMSEESPVLDPCIPQYGNIYLLTESLPDNTLALAPIDSEALDLLSPILSELQWRNPEEKLDAQNTRVYMYKTPEGDSFLTINCNKVFDIKELENLPQIGAFITHDGKIFYMCDGILIPACDFSQEQKCFLEALNLVTAGRFNIVRGENGKAEIAGAVPYLN